MEIIIENENTQLAEYKINFEQAKSYLVEEMKKYDKLVVTEEYFQNAKKTRAELNAKKKELTERFRAVKKKHNEPIEHLKSMVDELLGLIDEPLLKIDEQIKECERKFKEQKAENIEEIFGEIREKSGVYIKIETIFNPKWLNSDYSKKKITEEITCFFDRVKKDLEVIESFDDEFVIPLKEFYMECFDMSTIMQKKIAFDKAKKERIEQELKQKEKEDELRRMAEINTTGTGDNCTETVCEFEEIPSIEENDIGEDEIKCGEYGNDDCQNTNSSQVIADDLRNENDLVKENIPEPQETSQENQSPLANDVKDELELIKFWVKVTPEQKLKLRECVLTNHIKCGKLV